MEGGESFQSSPTPGSRCNISDSLHTGLLAGFNPHRLLGVGATAVEVQALDGIGVSILTDSWESVQRALVRQSSIDCMMFQSSPTPGSRCNDP